MAKNIIHRIMFLGLVNISILLLISQLTQAASISYDPYGNPYGNPKTTTSTTPKTTSNTTPSPSQESDIQKSLVGAATELQRQALLNDSQYVFDFLHPTGGVSTGTGGQTVAANVCKID
jgi:hypothetical protein